MLLRNRHGSAHGVGEAREHGGHGGGVHRFGKPAQVHAEQRRLTMRNRKLGSSDFAPA